MIGIARSRLPMTTLRSRKSQTVNMQPRFSRQSDFIKWISGVPDSQQICRCGHPLFEHDDRALVLACYQIVQVPNNMPKQFKACDRECSGFQLSQQLTERAVLEAEKPAA